MDRVKPILTIEERRARRAERRAKQREANVGRAHKMHLARLANEADARESLATPVEPSAITDTIPRLNIGCSGWFYWHWRDQFYPPGMKTGEWFQHYAG